MITIYSHFRVLGYYYANFKPVSVAKLTTSSKCIKISTNHLGDKQDFDVSSDGPSS